MRAFKTVVSLCVLATMSVPAMQARTGDQDRFGGRRLPLRATLQVTTQVLYPGDPNYDAGCGSAPMAEFVGVGTGAELGVLNDHQIHCLGATDFSTDPITIPLGPGSFKFTDARGRTLVGHYRGKLVQTFAGYLGEMGPQGSWLLEGEACVSGGTIADRIVDDCAANRYAPIKGMQNLTMQQATLFFDQTFGAREWR